MSTEAAPTPVATAKTSAIAELEIRAMQIIDHIENVAQDIEGVGAREIALAKTKIEEAVMWATRGIKG